jgi:hypothetical protein
MPHPPPLALPLMAGQIASLTELQFGACREIDWNPSRAFETQDSQLVASADESWVARQSLKVSSSDGQRSSASVSVGLVGLGTGALTGEGGKGTGPNVISPKDGAAVGSEVGAADGAEVVNTDDGTRDGGPLSDAVGVGGGATGLVGNDGVVGGGEYEHVRKQSDPQLQVSYASMYDPQVPQLLVQASIWLQMAVVSSPHVVSLVTRSQ